MQADILKNIDILAEMAESSNDINTLEAELQEIKKESNSLKEELDYLNDIIGEEKYFRASERQVDENIKVSLEAKIKKQEKAIQELQEELATILEEEQKLHDQIENKKNQINSSNEYIAVLKRRIEKSNDEDSQYNEVLAAEEQKLEKYNEELNSLLAEYDKLTEKIKYLNLAKEEMLNKLTNEKNKLNDTKASLVNPTAYIDYSMKKIDDDRIALIKNRLHELDKRRLEIMTDPVVIADDAKNLIMEDNRTGALAKIKELVTIVKTKPYMDIPTSSDLENLLREELVNASDKRDEFAALIDSKDYASSNNQIALGRIEFLKKQIETLKAQIESYKQLVKSLDNEEFNSIKKNINEAQTRANDLEQQIVLYEEIINNNDADKTPRRKAVLNSSLTKKQEELEIIKKIISTYEKDEKNLVLRTNKIIEENISSLENLIAEYEKEIDSLNKLNLNSADVKDVLAIENDKRKLKELDNNVKDIKHRQKYSRTPSEIFDEIEIYFGTLDITNDQELEVETDSSLTAMPTEPVLNNDYQDIPAYEYEIPTTSEPVLEESTVINELPDIQDLADETTGERKKVINVENIGEQQEESNEADFIIGDYKDDDYEDMASILNSDEVA